MALLEYLCKEEAGGQRLLDSCQEVGTEFTKEANKEVTYISGVNHT